MKFQSQSVGLTCHFCFPDSTSSGLPLPSLPKQHTCDLGWPLGVTATVANQNLLRGSLWVIRQGSHRYWEPTKVGTVDPSVPPAWERCTQSKAPKCDIFWKTLGDILWDSGPDHAWASLPWTSSLKIQYIPLCYEDNLSGFLSTAN